MRTFETLAEALNDLTDRGYEIDFNVHPEWIEDGGAGKNLHPAEFTIDEWYRFEGMTDPGDSAIVLAISSTSGLRGFFVDAYGAYTSSLTPRIVARLRAKTRQGQS